MEKEVTFIQYNSNTITVGEPNDDLADLLDLFETQSKYKLLFSTRKDKIPEKIEEKVYGKVYNQTIFSFVVNSQAVADKYEHLVGPFDIIAMAYRLKKQGQHVRVVIDCITEVDDYQKEYKPLLDVLNDFLKPEQITIGDIYGQIGFMAEERTAIYSWFKQNLECKEVIIYAR